MNKLLSLGVIISFSFLHSYCLCCLNVNIPPTESNSSKSNNSREGGVYVIYPIYPKAVMKVDIPNLHAMDTCPQKDFLLLPHHTAVDRVMGVPRGYL